MPKFCSSFADKKIVNNTQKNMSSSSEDDDRKPAAVGKDNQNQAANFLKKRQESCSG